MSDAQTITPAREPAAGAPALARAWRIAAMAAVLGCLAWFTVPVFAGHYNEGFQELIVLDAEAILHGGTERVDLLYRLVNDFFLTSRFGVSLVMAGLLGIGLPAVTAFRLVMLVSLVALVGASATILVRHYRVHPVFALLPALLFPGLFESAWFFNDNVLSAALSSVALALVWSSRSLPRTAASAVLWGLAITCRTDAVLLAPAFLVLMLFGLPTWTMRLKHALVAAPLVAAVPLLSFAAFGLNFLHILPLTHRAQVAWDRHDPISHVIHPLLKAFAYPGMVAMAAGIASVIVRRQWREILLCLGVPLIYFAAYGLMLTEVRYLLPLTPFFGILMAEGAHAVARATPRVRTAGLALFGLALLSCCGPPLLLPDHRLWFLSTDDDMPRPTIGRFWSPAIGLWWNHRLEQGFDATATALEDAARPGGLGIVVSTRWTPDHSVELLLQEHGFTGVRATSPASCAEIGEVFTRGPDRLLHMRAHVPLIPTERASVTWQALGAPCLRDLGKTGSDRVLVVGQMATIDPLPGGDAPGVQMIYLPTLDINHWASKIAGKSFIPVVMTAPIAQLPELMLQPTSEARRALAQWAIAHRDLVR